MDLERYNKQLQTLKTKIPSEKLNKELLHKLEMTADFAFFFESEEEQNILFELEENTNLIELENYEKELNDRKF
ncbi:MAG: hypothetical protein J5779_01095 [Clostridia bacterium]|nr:hypothetical protein [Clostridia bacterium]